MVAMSKARSPNLSFTNLSFDREAYLANFSDMETLAYETIDSFLSILPALIFDIESAIRSRNAEGLQISAHTLKGNLSNFYAESAELLAWQLEQMGHGKIMDATERVFQELKVELSRFSNDLKEFATKRKIE